MGSPIRKIERRQGKISRKQGPKGSTFSSCVDLGEDCHYHFTKGFRLTNKVKRELKAAKKNMKSKL